MSESEGRKHQSCGCCHFPFSCPGEGLKGEEQHVRKTPLLSILVSEWRSHQREECETSEKIIQAEINPRAGFITCKEEAVHNLLFLSNWQDWIGEMSQKRHLNKRQNYHNFGIKLAFPKYQLDHKMFMFAFLLEFKCRIPHFLKGASSRGGGVGCGAEQGWGGSWQSPGGKRSSEPILRPATRCIQLQPGSVMKRGRIVSSAANSVQAWSRPAAALQSSRRVGGAGGPRLSAGVWAARVGLLWRAKFSCRCVDALLSKTVARLLSNWHLLNKKAKDKIRGQRDGALSSAWSTYSHRRAFWLQLVQVNCTVRE